MSPILVILCSFFAMIVAQDPNLGDPRFLASYPPCAAQCQIAVIARSSNPCAFTTSRNLTCQCDSGNRAATAACAKLSCSSTEYDTTQTLAQQLCGPLYTNNTLNPTPVSSAIASATAAATAAVAGKDATNSNDYPACAISCQQQNLPSSGCGTLANKSCVCNSPAIVTSTGACEIRTCSPADLATTSYLSCALCNLSLKVRLEDAHEPSIYNLMMGRPSLHMAQLNALEALKVSCEVVWLDCRINPSTSSVDTNICCHIRAQFYSWIPDVSGCKGEKLPQEAGPILEFDL